MKKTSATPLIALLSHAKSQLDDDRRDGDREPLITPAVVQPLTEALRPTGRLLEAVTRDVSRRGVGLIVQELPESRHLAVQLTIDGHEKTLLCRVRWHEPSGPFVFLGLDVIRTLDGMPRSGEFSKLPG